jgi:hypothetical protein
MPAILSGLVLEARRRADCSDRTAAPGRHQMKNAGSNNAASAIGPLSEPFDG